MGSTARGGMAPNRIPLVSCGVHTDDRVARGQGSPLLFTSYSKTNPAGTGLGVRPRRGPLKRIARTLDRSYGHRQGQVSQLTSQNCRNAPTLTKMPSGPIRFTRHLEPAALGCCPQSNDPERSGKFVLGFVFFAFLFAAAGSLVSRAEDVAQAAGQRQR